MPTQQETLEIYTALLHREPDWSGRLLLSIGLNRTLALAALAAGAATLVLEDNATLLKQALQDVTFTVTTLDEALRALKNEIRQGRAVTVALTGNSQQWLHEMHERGVRPDLTVDEAANKFVSLTNDARSIQEDHAATLQERRTRDAALLQANPEQRQWLQAAPSLFPRDLTRVYLSDDQRLQPLP